MRTNIFRRAVVAGATVAVATAGLAFAPSATAASDAVDFDCTVPILGAVKFKVTADTDLPEYVAPGGTADFSFTAKVSVPDSVRGSAVAFFGDKVKGSADVVAQIGGQASPVAATLPLTSIPTTTGPLNLTVKGGSSWTAPTTLGPQAVTVSAFTANLVFVKGTTETPLAVPCAAPGGSVTIDTVTVGDAPAVPAMAATKTTAKAKYAKKTKKATVNVKVVDNKKKAVKGKVNLTLKKGKKVVGKKTVTLNKKGVAKGVFKVKAKGKYTVVAQYQGTKTTKKSKATAKFTVKK